MLLHWGMLSLKVYVHSKDCIFFNGLSCWQCKITFLAKTYINVTLDHKISHKSNFFGGELCIT